MKGSYILLISFVILSVYGVAGLKCYVCSSNVNDNCGDPFENREDILVECPPANDHVQSYMSGTSAINCRKLKQTVDGKHQVITRMCGYIQSNDTTREDKSCFKDAFSSFSNSIYCDCLGDGCNHADTKSKISQFVIFFGIFIVTWNFVSNSFC